jgi:low affinity Fe/Cu permease
MNERFNSWALRASDFVGSSGAFVGASVVILLWAATGPLMDYSDTWQLIVNTGTSVVTFLIVFLIQQAQNRDARSIRLKLDELLRVTHGARPFLLDLDRLSEREIEDLERQFIEWRKRAERNQGGAPKAGGDSQ